MSTLHRRVIRLEQLQSEQARKPGQPWWWELQEDQWQLGAVGLSHEEALAELDAIRDADGEGDAP